MDQFTPHGTYTVSNCIGYEVEIANSGDAARLRHYDPITEEPEITEWLSIEFTFNEEWVDSEDDDEFIAVIDPEGYQIPLNQVMRIR